MTSGKDQIIQRSVSGLKMPAWGVQLEPSVAMGTVCGSPWFPPSPQLILGEDYVTPGLKEQTGRLLEDTHGSRSWLYQLVPPRQGRARHCPVLATDARQAPRSGDTVAHQGSSLPAAAHLEICSNKLPDLAVGSFEGCGCCGK